MSIRGWEIARLADVATKVGSGSTPRGGKQAYHASGVPLIRSMNIHFDRFYYDGLAFLDADQAGDLDNVIVKANDVLLNITGASIGRVNQCPAELDGARVNQHVCIIRPAQDYSPTFLRYFLSSPQQQSVIFRLEVGVTRQALTKEMVLNFDVPIAPLDEQRRIVEKIDELFSDLDAGVAALERIRAKLKRYRAAVLKAAVEGKLTADWRAKHPNVEPAADLLKRILAERRRKWEEAQLAKFAEAGKEPPKGWREKYQEPTGPDISALPALPKAWEWVTLETIADVVGGLTKDKKRADEAGVQEISYLRVANVQRGFLDLSEIKPIFASKDDLDELRLIRGDILFTEGGDRDKLGRGWVWDEEIPDCIHQNHVFRARLFGDGINPKLVSHHGNTFGQLWFNTAGKQTTNLASINMGILRRFPVPIAPAAEQSQINAEVEQRLSIVDTILIQVETNLKRAGRLRQSILKDAFEGKLVPQVATDEPASALLERIRRQRGQVAESPTEANGEASATKRKDTREGFFRRGAVVTYIVKRLSSDLSFGRTKLEKILHLTQTHLSFPLDLEFKRHAAGPFDEVIYKLEGAAKKNGWFETRNRPSFGVTYHPGPKADDLTQRAVTYLGETQTALDKLLDHLAKMNTDQAELLATTYAAWNDLLIDGRPADEDTIIAEVYGWDESKAKFSRPQIIKCIAWMHSHGYVPTGQGQRTTVLAKKSKLRSKRKRPQDV